MSTGRARAADCATQPLFPASPALAVLAAGLLAAFSLIGAPPPARYAEPGEAGLLASASRLEHAWRSELRGALRAENRGHHLSTRVTAEGVLWTRRRGTGQEQQVELRLVAATRGAARREAGDAAMELRAGRAELHRAGLPLVEWYVNDPRGVEQGLDVARDPVPGDGPLRFVFATRGTLSAVESGGGHSIEFRNPDGGLELQLASLVAIDSAQRSLPARMRVAGGELVYELDDRGAQYPIVVDPLASSASFQTSFPVFDPGTDSYPVSTAGDVNGDGYSDLLVALPNGLPFPATENVFLYLGGASGLSATADWQASVSFPVNVSTAGDVNGDGYDDILVGSREGFDEAELAEGGALLWLGSADIASRPDGTPGSADWSAESNQDGAGRLFYAPTSTFDGETTVATGGDLNGDGFADVVVGFPGYEVDPGNPGTCREGVVLVWLGGPTFASTADGTPLNAAWRADGVSTVWDSCLGAGTSKGLGSSLSTAGDVNGDGLDDLIAGAKHSIGTGHFGGAFLWLGSATLASDPDGTLDNAAWSYSSPSRYRVGADVSLAGDVDGDGLGDVAVLSNVSITLPNDMEVGLFRGSASMFLEGSPSFTKTMQSLSLSSGTYGIPSVSTAGDVNGDGLADVVIGTPYKPFDPVPNGGDVAVYAGRRGTTPNPTAYALRTGGVTDGALGLAVGTAGDVNGDGFSDVVAAGRSSVQVRVYLGAGDTVAPVSSHLFTPAEMNAGGDPYTAGIGMGDAGDINGDGYGDFVVGIPGADSASTTDQGRFEVDYGGSCGPACGPTYLGGPGYYEGDQFGERLGWSVTGAGDVNGDGYGDVIVGAPDYDATVGMATVDAAGRARVYYGSFSGLMETGWTPLDGPQTNAARFGTTVAGACDVNGDGLRDVLVAAPGEDHNGLLDNGSVYLYIGTPSGISTTSVWMKSGATDDARFGHAAACAGDTNRDGYSDVIVGAYQGGPAGQGQAYVFLGEIGGVASTPVWTGTGSNTGDAYGQAVASAGDVNRDGYADIIVGQPYSDGVVETESRAYVHHGSSSGPQLAPSATLLGTLYGGDFFGGGVGPAGDVNGDGYSDVVVGAQWWSGEFGFAQGRALLYHGSPSGVVVAPARILSDCQAAPCDFGRSVVGGGDLNGDGFSDVLVSAYRLSTVAGGPDVGGVFAHFGNLETGVNRLPRQTFFGSPLDLLASLRASAGNFGVGMVLSSPAGRSQVRLEIELEPLASLFDGLGTVKSALLDTGTVATQATNSMLCGLNANCHWRVRVHSRNPYFPSSPWFSPQGNGVEETDVRGPTGPDGDGDGVIDSEDNCPTVANAGQQDGGGGLEVPPDGVGDACDNCLNVNNPRVAPTFLTSNAWGTLTGGQRDDDHDGYGNKCDGKFVGAPSGNVGPLDLGQYRASSGEDRRFDTCGTINTRSCAIFDLDEGAAANAIGPLDLGRFRAISGTTPGPRCAACTGTGSVPLPCTAGSAGACF